MKKDVKALIKRLTLLVQFRQLGKGWVSIDGNGCAWISDDKPVFHPNGESESLDYWSIDQAGRFSEVSNLDNRPLSQACPSLTSKEALFYTDGETVWLVEIK